MSAGSRFVLPYQTVIDMTGVPLPGAFLYFYISGTSTPLDTYSDQGLTVPNTNPVQANAAGVFPNIFLSPVDYKVVLTDSLDDMIWTADPVDGIGVASQSQYYSFATTTALLAAFGSGVILPNGTQASTTGRTNADGPGGAVFFYNSTDTTTADNGGTIRVDGQGRRWYAMTNQVTPQLFGAAGDGVTDDTTALQAAINYIVGTGTELFLGAAKATNYLISAAINIPVGQYWYINGGSRGSTITQATNNTQIFKFAADACHSWHVSDIIFTWSNAQPSTNTLACAFWFTGNGNSRYIWEANRLTFQNGFRSFSNDISTSPVTWGCHVHDCWHESTMTGAFWWMGQAVSAGQPNVSLEDIYIEGELIVASDPCIYQSSGDSVWFNNIEINATNNGNILIHAASTHGAIGVIKVEVGTYGAGSVLMLFEDSHFSIGQANFESLTITGNTSAISVGGAAASIIVQSCNMTFQTAIVGAFYLAVAEGPTPGYNIRFVDAPVGLLGTSGAYLTNVGSTTSPEGVSVDAWQQPRLSADQGDASATWSIGTSETVMQWLTTLTAARTLTLSDAYSGGDSNLYDGFVLRVVRNNATPGAYTLTILNAVSGTVAVIDSTNGSVDLMWQRFSWRVTNFTTWSGVAP